ncbi:hypothetical protein [Streptomyces sp. NBC_01304]|uniref:hypothetical protein n=1 Tax=Streptomyces sp. NBC_01304 TaxID=2903818 RepID=UPI002E0EF58E|nr:hypothetical protein OG430_12175 [Streptomyces sp. NBC_01304]
MVALPAEPDGIPMAYVIGYAAVLALAAADGARRALRTPLGVARLRSGLAVILGLVLLLVPAGGAYAYDAAHDEAVEKMLLERLDKADKVVDRAEAKTFAKSEKDYTRALGTYGELGEDHAGSRAADRVPDSLDALYKAVAQPYTERAYCEAVEPLKYLRTVPKKVDEDVLGKLAKWPDERLATSFYECGMSELGSADEGGGSDGGGGSLAELLSTFPESKQADKVEPDIRAEIDSRVEELKGSDPCEVTEGLRNIGKTVGGLPPDASEALSKESDSSVEKGVFACGVDQFKDKDFEAARATMDDYAKTYPDSGRHGWAKDIATAAEIAKVKASAGSRLPPERAPGGKRTVFLVLNDSPESGQMLYTGPMTGTADLKACGSCKVYPTRKASDDKSCSADLKKYPKVELRLTPGTYHFLSKRGGDGYGDEVSTVRVPGDTIGLCSTIYEK